ncbi:uncharacterized protein LOC122646851 isoform X2 [Telopea speciosissima]|uniref:uncharacterized protein LOC122646851 isoform X2 n=1 Tax=Telopea speciosissima TaxID=54955 RepID=UPI001CC79ED5|nr:uncharacterized protein LOC122646851 isoform X2 [Telopea speciosissima]
MAEEEENVEAPQPLVSGQEKTEGLILTPWEQHSAVINLPRFNYNAPSSLLENFHSGFLITCPIKREKSATKEGMCILEKYVGTLGKKNVETIDADVAVKRRKISSEEIGGKCLSSAECEKATDNLEDSGETSIPTTLSSARTEADTERNLSLSLVKLTRSGLLLFIFPKGNSSDGIRIVSNIFHSLDSGNLKPPQWCNRIFPIQATCALNEKDLRIVVLKLVQQFLNDKQNNLEKPIKFAVGYNRRGIEETEMKSQRTAEGSILVDLLDRNKCFSVVAGAVKDVVADSVVDLKSPQFAILVELLPVSGLPNGSLVVAVSVLPNNLVSTKPRLCIKALVSETKSKNKV